MAIQFLWEIGYFHCLLDFSNVYFSTAVWTGILIGFGIQTVLLSKCRRIVTKYAVVGFTAIAAVVCDFACQGMIGWELMGGLLIYGAVLAIFIGASMACVARFLAGMIHDLQNGAPHET